MMMEENKKINHVQLLKVKLLKISVHLMTEYCQDLIYLYILNGINQRQKVKLTFKSNMFVRHHR
jgi:hypothetical protein